MIFDASVAVKWTVLEAGSGTALDLLRSARRPAAPTFLLVESANVLWKKVARGELQEAQAMRGFEGIRKALPELIPDRELLPHALAIAVELSHPVYDCLYLFCGERLALDVVTADRKLFNKTRNTRFAARVHLLDGMD